MKVVIIEDEALAAETLSDYIKAIDKNIEIEAILSSVSESLDYFRVHQAPDLIFSDIHLGDGHSFHIYKEAKIAVPIIFCTAFNEYALEAFKNNGIDYILKPFEKKDIREAVDRYKQLKSNLSKNSSNSLNLEAVLEALQSKPVKKKETNLLVNFKDKIIPIKIEEVAVFFIDYKTTQVVTFDNKRYSINYTLEELEAMTEEKQFYRANRQFLINKAAIKEVSQFFARKLTVEVSIEGKYDIIVSKNKATEFLEWLRQ